MKKTIFYVIFALVVGFLSFLVIRPIFIKNNLLSNTNEQNVSNTTGWKTYQFDKQYKNAFLHFKLNYPQEWQPKEEGESVGWYSGGKQKIFTVSWLHPDFVYDVEGICRAGMCDKLAEISIAQQTTIEISKPTSERQTAMNLPDTFLLGEIVKSNNTIIPTFSTEVLSIDEFRTVLATFSFTD
ncbi:MAG: hypothetical protein ABIA91_01615 [Patescibacteria group bacterium]|nr:hypothetical protein [Patescibacteria group bacterium]